MNNIGVEQAYALLNDLPDTDIKFAMLEHLESFAEFVEEGSSKIIFYDTTTTLPYLAIKNDIVIIKGDLIIAGILEDCLEVYQSLLLVLGNVQAKNLFTFSQICITGNLFIQNAIIASSVCVYSLDVGNNVNANIIAEDGHWFNVNGTITANEIYASHATTEKKGRLNPTIDDDGLLDTIKTNDRIDVGKTIQLIISGERKINVYRQD